MKLVKLLPATLIVVLSSSVVQAFTPPYHISGMPYVGTLSIQSAGSCKINATYEGAQWGQVRDSVDAVVGYGLISADGELLAVRENSEEISGFYDGDKNITRMIRFVDLDSDATVASLSALGGCNISDLITSAKSRNVYSNKAGYVENIIDHRFNGIMPATITVDGSKEMYKKNVFKGRILFKGKPMV